MPTVSRFRSSAGTSATVLSVSSTVTVRLMSSGQLMYWLGAVSKSLRTLGLHVSEPSTSGLSLDARTAVRSTHARVSAFS